MSIPCVALLQLLRIYLAEQSVTPNDSYAGFKHTQSCCKLSLVIIEINFSIFSKVPVLIHSLIPNFFSPNKCRFWYQNLSHIKKAICVKCQNLENMVLTINKTISNINIVFSNCLQMRYILFLYLELSSPWMIISVRKVTISASLRKIHFPNILEQAPLR